VQISEVFAPDASNAAEIKMLLCGNALVVAGACLRARPLCGNALVVAGACLRARPLRMQPEFGNVPLLPDINNVLFELAMACDGGDDVACRTELAVACNGGDDEACVTELALACDDGDVDACDLLASEEAQQAWMEEAMALCEAGEDFACDALREEAAKQAYVAALFVRGGEPWPLGLGAAGPATDEQFRGGGPGHMSLPPAL